MAIIKDILKEMKEQMCLEERDCMVPLVTVRKMMSQGWVWGYQEKVFSKYLLTLEECHEEFV